MSEQDVLWLVVSVLWTAIVALLAFIAGFHSGWNDGRKCGKDEQWTDEFIQRANADRARRDKAGRFTPKKPNN